jgi:glycosyltransferase involved in cell wall biosynthesis
LRAREFVVVFFVGGEGMFLPGFLICYHVEANTGYAIEPLEKVFFNAVSNIVDDNGQINLGYSGYKRGCPKWFDGEVDRLITLHYANATKCQLDDLSRYISASNIKYVLAFDLPVGSSLCGALRKGGVKKIISYWGAPMSSLNNGLKLFIKRIQVGLTRYKPDHYIFESFAMAETAYKGRGISKSDVSIVPLAVDTSKFTPLSADLGYAHRIFRIPESRKIIYYSGHMEKRKGVSVLLKAAKFLYEEEGRRDFQFLILGNKNGEEAPLLKILMKSNALEHVTFGGYRDDVPKILPCCYIGAIASIGWDSFTMTSLEIAACGLPLLVSKLQGLVETIDEGKTGYSFEPGNYKKLAEYIVIFFDNPDMRLKMGESASKRIRSKFTRKTQVDKLEEVISTVINS